MGEDTTRTRISHRDLRNRSSEILRSVQAGSAYEVTNNGELVGLVLPVERDPGAALRIRPANRRGGFIGLPRVRLESRVTDALDDLRGQR